MTKPHSLGELARACRELEERNAFFWNSDEFELDDEQFMIWKKLSHLLSNAVAATDGASHRDMDKSKLLVRLADIVISSLDLAEQVAPGQIERMVTIRCEDAS